MALYSPYWYRAESLKPRLKQHCEIGRQVHRQQIWYVISNRASGEFFRVTPPAYTLIGLMDGQRTIDEIWRAAAQQLGDNLPTQDEVIQLLARMHQADLINTNAAPDMKEIAERRDKRAQAKKLSYFKNPFAIRIPLFDPDPFLSRWSPFVSPVFTFGGAIAFALLITYTVILAGLNWPELTSDIRSHLAATETLLLILLVYPLIKAAHELGHGFTIKHWRGETREMGVMLLFFMPVPYVDASASTLWPDKWQRALVSAMGAFTEIAIASVALIIWVNTEPGWVKAIAFTVMATGGISTLLFNGNPLLRFDGYYALSDLIEIPNLGQRSNNYFGYLLSRYVFRSKQAQFPLLAKGEAPWLVIYSVAAYFYRLSVAFAVALLVSTWLFELGLLLAIWAVTQMVVIPAYKAFKHVFVGETLMSVRRRAVMTTLGFIGVVIALVALLPLPYHTVARALVHTQEAAILVASGSGFIADFKLPDTNMVEVGTTIYQLSNRRLLAQREAGMAQLESFRAGIEAGRAKNQTAARQAREQFAQARAALERLDAQIADLIIRSPANGRFVAADPRQPLGRYIEQGRTLGYIIDPDQPIILQVVVPEGEADLIRERKQSVEVWFPHIPEKTFSGRISRQLPSVDDKLPSAALSNLGRGPFQLDPAETNQLKSTSRFVIFEVLLDEPPPNVMVGATADVRVSLGWSPILVQIARPLLQLLLKVIAG